MKEKEVVLSPEEGYNEEQLHVALSKMLNGQPFKIIKRSIDARKKTPVVRLRVGLYPATEDLQATYSIPSKSVENGKRIIIVGSGPAGLFAALKLIDLGLKPVIIERGSDVRKRRRDLAAINKEHVVNHDSNYCFGEGGAGTYSDGKLYTRSKKRGDIQRILEILVAHGAKDEILYEAHPHIGTNKLPKIVTAMRETILENGGEVYFNQRVVDFIIQKNQMKGVITDEGNEFVGEGVILATGHSARDIFELLHQKKIELEAKPFAIGVRAEHRQSLIDKIQYGMADRGDYLPASSYSLVAQIEENNKERGVFSFCMCPGGFIVPSATETGEVVVNGMSPSRRDSKYANSGIVAAVNENDWQKFTKYGPLAGMYFQAEVEKNACVIAGNRQTAPAQLITDFCNNKTSAGLLDTSYQPGLQAVDMKSVLPASIHQALQKAFRVFGKKMKGYYTPEAQVVGVESRTSSPVRIPRDRVTLEHPQIKRLVPCGEGAGYAGGIVSAAMDGERCADAMRSLVGVPVNQ